MKSSHIVLEVMKELKYYAISKRGPLIKKALEYAFDTAGERGEITELFLDHLSIIHGIDDDGLATRFDVVEDTIQSVFGESAPLIIEVITNYLLAKDHGLKNNYSSMMRLSENLEKIYDKEALEFVRSLSPHEHVLFLYQSQKSKVPLFSSFFDKEAAADMEKGVISSGQIDLPKDSPIDQITYNSIVNNDKTSIDLTKCMAWMRGLLHRRPNAALRVLGAEDTWFFESGLSQQILAFENKIGRHVDDRISYVCTYDINKLNNKVVLKELVNAHSYVILDAPFYIYCSPE